MKRFCLYCAIAMAGALVTVVVYEPFTAAFFKIREPHFKHPLGGRAKYVAIRNDSRGSGEFGAKRRSGRSHGGIDLQAPVGSSVFASKSGLAFRGNVPTGFGKYVMIYHPDGFQTIYGHLSDWAIGPVEKVRRGEHIGFVGRTGNAANKSIQSHLHFEIRKDGESFDPKGLIR